MSTNELLERYLQAVKFWLPRAQQQDILAELAEDLQSQMEDREAALGRPLTENDMVALLKQRGAPMRVASGFIAQQRLVDPAMVPVYRLVLKIILLWVMAPLFALMLLGALFTSPHSIGAVGQVFAKAMQSGFGVVGMVTVMFAIFDHFRLKFSSIENWDPRKLPRVAQTSDTSLRWNRLASSVFGFAAAGFWIWIGWITRFTTAVELPGGYGVELAPIWFSAYWVLLAVTLIDAATDFGAFLDPPFGRTRSRIRIALDVVMITMASVLLNSPQWLTLTAAAVTPAQMAKLMQVVNGSIRLSLFVVIGIALIDAVVNLRRLMGRPPMVLTQVPPVHL